MIALSLKKSFVQILSGNTVLGNGFFGPAGSVVTCAHVVRSSGKERPELRVAFHWIEGKPVFPASVVEGGWRYDKSVVDIAILTLQCEPPDQAKPLRLASRGNDRFEAELEPYIPGLGSSRRIDAKVDGIDENGRLSLVPINTHHQWIESGVSGSPVLARDGELVEGIIMEADAKVQQAVVCPASCITALLEKIAQADPAAPAAAMSQASADGNSRGGSAVPGSLISKTPEDLVSDFLGTDPVRGNDAINALAKGGPDQLRVLLGRTNGSTQHIIRMRKLCARIGPEAMSVLVDAIRDGPPSFAACYFTESAGHESNDALYGLLKKRDFDVQGRAINAVGYSGYSSSIRWDLVRLAKYDSLQCDGYTINGYSFEKLSSDVVRALARGFARTGNPSELTHLGKFMALCTEKARGCFAEEACREAFEDLTPAAADALIADWLPRPDGPYTRLALYGLDLLRLRRTSVAAVPYVFDKRADVSVAAGRCLGNTGCDTVARKLAAALDGNITNPGIGWAFSMLYSRDADWPKREQYLHEFLPGNSEIAGLMLVSSAQREPKAILDKALRGLADTDAYYRGASALATAWACPADVEGLLGQADEEASNEIERLFIVAAQVLAGLPDRGKVLNEALKAMTRWSQLLPFWRLQVLAALQLSGLDSRYGQLWAEVSRDNTNRAQALVKDYVRRARGAA